MFSIFSTLKLTVKNGKILLFFKFGGGYMEVNYTIWLYIFNYSE